MSAKTLLVRICCLSVLMAFVTAAMAEAPPRKALSVRITPELIQQSAAASVTLPSTDQPPTLSKQFQQHELFRHAPQNVDHLPNACAKKGGSLCFDYRTGRTVYKPMRKLLPEIPGMTPHNLSIRRDKLVAHYTFK